MAASTPRGDMAAHPIPRGEKRRREIAAIAERVFFETGFTDTTMQAIAARAGASKETLYRHFGSKEELFAEAVANRARCFLADLDQRFERPGTVADVLRSLGLVILQTMMGNNAVALCRIVVAECPRNPDLGPVFMSAGPDRVRSRLTEYFAAATRRGDLACADPECAARIFLGAVLTSFHLSHLVLQDPPVLSPARARDHVEEVVAMFMDRYRAPGCRAESAAFASAEASRAD